MQEAKPVADAIGVLRHACMPTPQISDDIGLGLPARAVATLRAHAISTLADLTVRIARRRQWWRFIPGLCVASAQRIEAVLATHPALTERARALIAVSPASGIVPWEQVRLHHEVDGSAGAYRARHATCTLDADNDYRAVVHEPFICNAPSKTHWVGIQHRHHFRADVVPKNRGL